MLTKSLHTITAATNVARYILTSARSRNVADITCANPRMLADSALTVLGQGENAHTVGDETVARIVANCAKLLKEAQS